MYFFNFYEIMVFILHKGLKNGFVYSFSSKIPHDNVMESGGFKMVFDWDLNRLVSLIAIVKKVPIDPPHRQRYLRLV